MREISLNILDICQNSITAGASLIEIFIDENPRKDYLVIEIKDNGCGMSEEMLARVMDPFTTTRTTRKVGLGIPLFKMSAEITGGKFNITSTLGTGTAVRAEYIYSSIDRMPLGDMTGTLISLVGFNENIDFYYKHKYNEKGSEDNGFADKEFVMDTREIKKILGGISLTEKEVAGWLKEFLNENYDYIYGKADNL